MEPVKLDDILRAAGLKATPRRRRVAQYLFDVGGARTPEEVWRYLRRGKRILGLPTVYRILEELAGIGLLTRVELADRNLRYAACGEHAAGHHHHVVCIKCGTVGVIAGCLFDRQVRAVERSSGFRITSHRLFVEGLCPRCQ